MLVVFFLILFGALVYAYITFVKQKPNSNNGDNKDNESVSVKDRLHYFYEKKLGPITTKASIVINTFQILSISLQSFKISMPTSYSKFISGLDILSINVVSVLPLNCMNGPNFVDTLILKTLFPLIVFGLLFICLMIEFIIRYKKLYNEHAYDQLKVYSIKLKRSLKFRYISLALLFLYLYLPGVTVAIFQVFVCENVDPGNVTSSNGDYYLVADYSMNCSSNYMKFAKVWASFMIVVYPVGIPLLYFWLLYTNRNEIISRSLTEDADTKTDDHKPNIKMFKFLYESYKPQYWYFELIETSRRLLLTGALSVVDAGASGQVVFGIIIAVFYMKIYAYCQPYELNESSIIAELSQYQIFFTFFGSLIVQNELLAKALYNDIIGGLMVVLNLSATLLSLYFEYIGLDDTLEKDQSSVKEVAKLYNYFSCKKKVLPDPTEMALNIAPCMYHGAEDDDDKSSYTSHIQQPIPTHDDDS